MKNVIIKKIRSFDPDITFMSGQCFRWTKNEGVWSTIAGCKYAEITGKYPEVYIKCEKEDMGFWENYFDTRYDYEYASDFLLEDDLIKKAVEKYRGMILLRQPFFETLISFIISSNNNIPRIKKIIDSLCKAYGEKIEQGYCFPKPKDFAKLKDNDLLGLGCGYRSKYIIETSKMIADGFDESVLEKCSLDRARDILCSFSGVGKKVADCVLIYSLGRKDAYPVDTWIRKASCELFCAELNDDEIRKRANLRFGDNAALAQQYMFVAERMKKEDS